MLNILRPNELPNLLVLCLNNLQSMLNKILSKSSFLIDQFSTIRYFSSKFSFFFSLNSENVGGIDLAVPRTKYFYISLTKSSLP